MAVAYNKLGLWIVAFLAWCHPWRDEPFLVLLRRPWGVISLITAANIAAEFYRGRINLLFVAFFIGTLTLVIVIFRRNDFIHQRVHIDFMNLFHEQSCQRSFWG